MNDHDVLMMIAEYLDLYEQDVWREFNRASDDIKPLVQAQISVVSEIIDYIEQNTDIAVRMTY
jgi:hypothetical protein